MKCHHHVILRMSIRLLLSFRGTFVICSYLFLPNVYSLYLQNFLNQNYQNRMPKLLPDYADYGYDSSPVILIHGGAGDTEPEDYQRKV